MHSLWVGLVMADLALSLSGLRLTHRRGRLLNRPNILRRNKNILRRNSGSLHVLSQQRARVSWRKKMLADLTLAELI